MEGNMLQSCLYVFVYHIFHALCVKTPIRAGLSQLDWSLFWHYISFLCDFFFGLFSSFAPLCYLRHIATVLLSSLLLSLTVRLAP